MLRIDYYSELESSSRMDDRTDIWLCAEGLVYLVDLGYEELDSRTAISAGPFLPEFADNHFNQSPYVTIRNLQAGFSGNCSALRQIIAPRTWRAIRVGREVLKLELSSMAQIVVVVVTAVTAFVARRSLFREIYRVAHFARSMIADELCMSHIQEIGY